MFTIVLRLARPSLRLGQMTCCRNALRLAALLLAGVLPMSAQAVIQRSILNPSFETGTTATLCTFVDGTYPKSRHDNVFWLATNNLAGQPNCGSQPQNPVWPSGAAIRPIEIWRSAGSGELADANAGSYFAELNSVGFGMPFQPICMRKGENFKYSFLHRGSVKNGGSYDTAEFRLGLPASLPSDAFPSADSYSYSILSVTTIGDNTGAGRVCNSHASTNVTDALATNGWRRYGGEYTYQGGTQLVNFGFMSIGSAIGQCASGGLTSGGNHLDDIRVQLAPFVEFTKSSFQDPKTGQSDKPRVRVIGDLTVDNTNIIVPFNIVGGTAVEGVHFNYDTANFKTLASDGYQWRKTSTGLTLEVAPRNFDGLDVGAGTSNNGIFELPITVLQTGTMTGDKDLQLSIPNDTNAPQKYLVDSTEICGGAANRTVSYVFKQTPLIVKKFDPQSIEINGVAKLTWTIQNVAGNPVQAALAFTDSLPSSLMVGSPANVVSTCAGAVTALPGSGQVSLSAGGINAGVSSCSVTVDITPLPHTSNTSCDGWPPGFTNTTAAMSGMGTSIENGVTPQCLIVTGPEAVLTKAFSVAQIDDGGTAELTFSLRNSKSSAVSGLYFTDTLPSDLRVLTSTAVVYGGDAACTSANLPVVLTSGSVALNSSQSSSLGVVPANATCTIALTVTNVAGRLNPDCTSTGADTFTNRPSSISPVGGNLINGVSDQCLIVRARPQLTKQFDNSVIIAGTNTVLKFHLEGVPTLASTGLGFVDSLPANIMVAGTSPLKSNDCGGTVTATPGATSVSLAGGAIPLGKGSCDIEVWVTNVGGANGTLNTTIPCAGAGFTNGNSNVAVTGLTNNVSNQCLQVVAPPTLTKSFSDTSIKYGASTRMTFTITEDSSAIDSEVSGTGFTDTLPAGLQLAALPALSNSCGATLTGISPGSTSVTLSGITIAAGTPSCEVSFNVTNRPGKTGNCPLADFTNYVSTNGTNVSGLTNLLRGNTDPCVSVEPEPNLYLTKLQAPGQIGAGESVTVKWEIINNGITPQTGVGFSDALPTGMRVVGTVTAGNATNCGLPTVNATQVGGNWTVALSGATVAAGATCTITATITNKVGVINNSCATNPAEFTNSAANISGLLPSPTLTNNVSPQCTVVNQNAVLTKKFLTSPILVGGLSKLEFTLDNSVAWSAPQSGIAFVDNLPSGITVAATPNIVNTCNGTVTASGGTIKLVDGSIAAGVTQCKITVDVTSTVVNTAATCPATHKNGVSNFSLSAADQKNVQNGVSDQCLQVRNIPILEKVLGSANSYAAKDQMITAGVPTLLTLRIRPNGEATAGDDYRALGFIDTLPAQWRLVTSAGYTTLNGCGGTLDTSADNRIVLSGATLTKGSSSCTIETWVVNRNNIIAPTCGGADWINGSGQISTSTLNNQVQNQCLMTNAAASLTKAYSKYSIVEGETSQLTFTLTNAMGNPALSGIGFRDTLPSGLRVLASSGSSSTCGGAVTIGGTFDEVITFSGGAMALGTASCTVSVAVTNRSGSTNTSCASNPAGFTNKPTNIDGLTQVNNDVTDQCLVVSSRNPAITKALSSNQIVDGSSTRLTFTAAVPSSTGSGMFAFTDNLPSNWRIAATPDVATTCKDFTNPNNAASVTATAGGSSIVVSNAQVATNTSVCTISVNVTNAPGQLNSSCAANPSAFTNNNASIAAATGINNQITNTCLVVIKPILALAKINPANLTVGVDAEYVLRVSNSGSVNSLTTVEVFDQLPPYMDYVGASVEPAAGAANAVTATSVSCVKSVDDLASGHVLTCTLGLPVGGIPANNGTNDGSVALRLKVQPKPGIALNAPGVVNKARVSPNNDNTQDHTTGPKASDCTGNDQPTGSGCAVSTLMQVASGVALEVSKDPPTPALTRGVASNYVIKVTNRGSGVANNATIREVLPANVDVLSVSAGWSCNATLPITGQPNTGIDLLCSTNVPLGANGSSNSSSTLTLSVRPQAGYTASDLTNAVSVDASGGTTPPDATQTFACTAINTPTAGCGAPVTGPVASGVALEVSKDPPTPALTRGVASNYVITVTNRGSGAANGATIRELLPANVDVLSASGTGWSCNATLPITGQPNTEIDLLCSTNAVLGANGSSTSTLTLSVQPQAGYAASNLRNAVSVDASGGTTPPDATQTSACTAINTPTAGCGAPVTSPVASGVALEVSKDPPTPALTRGVASNYVIKVTNRGSGAANGATIRELLPANVDVLSASGTGWSCNATLPITGQPNTEIDLLCSTNVPLGANGSSTSTLTLSVQPQAGYAASNLRNAVSVDASGGTTPPNATQTSACTAINTPTAGCGAPVTSPVASGVALEVSKDPPTPALTRGVASNYVITVTNRGSGAANGATIREVLPANVDVLSASGTGWSCNATLPITGQPNTEIDLLCSTNAVLGANGSSTSTLTLSVQPQAGYAASNLRNAVSVDASGGTTPPDATQTSACTAINTPTAGCGAPVTSPVASGVALEVSKDPPTPALTRGVASNYVITVTNRGSGAANGATIREVLPANVDVLSASGTGWSCNATLPITGQPNTEIDLLCSTNAVLGANGSSTSTLTLSVQPQAGYAASNLRNAVSVDASGGTTPPNATQTSACTAINTPTAGCGAPVTSPVASGVALEVSKDPPTPALTRGVASNYVITVTNRGSGAANGATIREVLPANVDVLSVSAGWNCNATLPITGQPNTEIDLLCSTNAVLGANAGTSTLTLSVRPQAGYTASNLRNAVSVDATGGTTPPDATQTSACTAINTPTAGCGAPVTSPVASGVALEVSKDPPTPALTRGVASNYVITVTNRGSGAANGATIREVLPANVDVLSASGTGWSCNATLPITGQPNTGIDLLCSTNVPLGANGSSNSSSTLTLSVRPQAGYTASDLKNAVSVDASGGATPPDATQTSACTAINTPTAGCGAPVTSPVGNNTIDAVDDAQVTLAMPATAQTAVSNLLANDSFKGAPASLGPTGVSIALGQANWPAGITLASTTAAVHVDNTAQRGTHSLLYTICEMANPANCDTARVVVSVTGAAIVVTLPASGTVNVVDDVGLGSTISGVPVQIGTNASVRATPGSSWPVGMNLTPGGAITLDPSTPPGSYTVSYELCNKDVPPLCMTETRVVQVIAPLIAQNDTGSVFADAGGVAIADVTANDRISGAPVTLGGAGNATVDPVGTWPQGVSLDPATGAVTVAPNTSLGQYSVQYRLCEKLTPTNCVIATVQVQVQSRPASIKGRVWFDVNHNGRYDENANEGLQGFGAEVVDGNGQSIECKPGVNDDNGGCNAITKPDGSVVSVFATQGDGGYSVTGLVPGAGFKILFYNKVGAPDPQNSKVQQVALTPGEQYDGEKAAAAAASGQPAAAMLPIDPEGVIYDSMTREPIAGVTIGFYDDSTGQLVPQSCLYIGANPQTTTINGRYQMVLAGHCAPATPKQYSLRITQMPGQPDSYRQSTLIAAKAGPLDTQGQANNVNGSYTVQPQGRPPALSDSNVDFYMSFMIGVGYPNIMNNHIPLDPVDLPLLVVRKVGDKSVASVGDVVRYTVVVQNQSRSSNVRQVRVLDRLPAGFKLIAGTARVQVEGSMQKVEIVPTGGVGPSLAFGVGDLAAGAKVTLTYAVRIAVGAQQGDGVNTVHAVSGRLRSLNAKHKVMVGGGVLTQEACVIGQVYIDGNGNGLRNKGEHGLAGVRMVLEDGRFVVSDANGAYHLCGLQAHMHVLKVDPLSVPAGSRFSATSNRNVKEGSSVFVDLKFGELHRVDFALQVPVPVVTPAVAPSAGPGGAAR